MLYQSIYIALLIVISSPHLPRLTRRAMWIIMVNGLYTHTHTKGPILLTVHKYNCFACEYIHQFSYFFFIICHPHLLCICVCVCSSLFVLAREFNTLLRVTKYPNTVTENFKSVTPVTKCLPQRVHRSVSRVTYISFFFAIFKIFCLFQTLYIHTFTLLYIYEVCVTFPVNLE